MPKLIRIILYALIFISFLFCLWLPLHNELIIQTDIARDFLLLEETVQKRIPPLIGAHSGISGIYHGPLWIDINLPAFILGGGNPATVGLFWVFLYAIALIFVFYTAKKMFNLEIALFSTALYAMISVQEINNLSNPYGALMLFPLFFYFFYRYIMNGKFTTLLLAIFILGLIIQFQMAFGIPILILAFLYLIVFLVKKRRLIHLSSLFMIFITQSTSIFFELRHNFLQTRSLISYLNSQDRNFLSRINPNSILNQIIKSYTEGLIFFTKNNLFLNLIFLISLIISLIYILRKKNLPNKLAYKLFIYFYLGYWFLIMFYHGQVWIYYHWAFIPVLIILFCSSYQIINKKIFILLFSLFISILLIQQINRFVERNNYMGVSQASWQFFKSSVDKVFKDARSDFGYYVVCDDQLGYQGKYAFHYMQKFYQNKAFAYQKKDPTYVYIVTSSDPGFNPGNFVKQRIKIASDPVKIMKFKNGIQINKYQLAGSDLNTPSDPNLLNSLIFR